MKTAHGYRLVVKYMDGITCEFEYDRYGVAVQMMRTFRNVIGTIVKEVEIEEF